MSTGQKYSGKGDSTTLQDQNGSNLEPTANQDPQAATTEPQSDSSPQQTITDEQPPFTIDGAKTAVVESEIKVNLPFFLRWQLQSEATTKNLIAAIEQIFDSHWRTDEAKKLMDIDLNQYLAYAALRNSVLDMIDQVATKRYGQFEKHRSSAFLFEAPALATGDPQLDTAPVLVDDPRSVTDTDKLYEWITTLQQMCRLQQKINLNNEQVHDNLEQEVLALATQVQAYKKLVKVQDQVEQKDKQLQIEREFNSLVPFTKPYIDLALYLHEGECSEIGLLQCILSDASEAKINSMLDYLINDETGEAWAAYEEHKQIQSILGRLSTTLMEVANDNYIRADYQKIQSAYLTMAENDRKREKERRDAFLQKYSVFTYRNDEDEQEGNLEEVSAETSKQGPQTLTAENAA